MIRPCAALASVLALAATALADTTPAGAPAVKATAPAPAAPAAPLTLLIGAPLGAEKARADAARLAKLFGDALARPVRAEILGHDELGKALAAGKGDLAWLSASQYLDASRASKGQAAPVAKLMRGGLPFYRSVLFALKSARVMTPKDLRGKKLAFVSEQSAAGYLLPRKVLLGAGFTSDEIRQHAEFLGDHAAVCRAVVEGKAGAGATVSNDRAGGAIAGCAETLGPRAADLKVVSTSDPIPNDVIAVRPGFPADGFAALRAALLKLDDSLEGKKALGEVFQADAFVASEDGDFALLRETLR